MKVSNKTVIAVVFASITSMNTAKAGGFLADTFIKPFSPEAAEAADQWNANNGNIVDHGIAAGANYVVPGAGAVIESGYAIQRNGIRCVFMGYNQNGQPVQNCN